MRSRIHHVFRVRLHLRGQVGYYAADPRPGFTPAWPRSLVDHHGHPSGVWWPGLRPEDGATESPSSTAAQCAVGAKRVKVERTLRTEGPPRVYLDARSETAMILAVKKGKQVTDHRPVATADPRKPRREGFRALCVFRVRGGVGSR